MHAKAAAEIDRDVVKAPLIDEIGRAKELTRGASTSGVRTHTLPYKPKDVEDDGEFHYVLLGPDAASESGKPSPEATRFLNETTSSEKPRVFHNAVILLTPTKDGVELARNAIRDYLAWEQVRAELKGEEDGGQVDVARMQALLIRVRESQGKIANAIYQAYSTVVTVTEKNEVQAFRISISDDPHFQIVKNDQRSRIKDSAITAESLLPGGPYDLWTDGQTAKRVKDLTGAFAQLPRLPKMLKAETILDTLVDGCRQGAFVLKLTRPDGSKRTWWLSEPDENARKDAALDLVLSESVDLAEIDPALVAKDGLAGLWTSDEITVQDALAYFEGGKVVQMKKGDYEEPMMVPKAGKAVVQEAVKQAVQKGKVWLVSGPTSIYGEEVAPGILTAGAVLLPPPEPVSVTEILPEVIPDVWTNVETTALAIATALSQKAGKTLPWKTVADVINQAINNRYLKLSEDSGQWPCDFSGAGKVALEEAKQEPIKPDEVHEGSSGRIAAVSVTCEEAQALLDALAYEAIPALLEIKAKTRIGVKVTVGIEHDPETSEMTEEAAGEIGDAAKSASDDFRILFEQKN